MPLVFLGASALVTADAPKRFQRVKAFLTQEGFRLVEGSLTHQKDYYRSGTIAASAEELNSLIRNLEVIIFILLLIVLLRSARR